MLERLRRYLRSLGGALEPDPFGSKPPVRESEATAGQSDESYDDKAYRQSIETRVSLKIDRLALYDRALSHRSLLRRKKDSRQYSNERLEFLGDAVLGFVVAEYLYLHFRSEDEGFLTRLRAKLVNGEALADAAREMDLGGIIRVSDNMVQKGGRDNSSVLADAFEAIIGALYLDLGMEAARDFIHRRLLAEVDMDHLAVHRDNYKSLLLEHVQAKGWSQPTYRLASEDGPSHNRTFTVDVIVNDKPAGRGSSNSKKKAEQLAAHEAITTLREDDADGAAVDTNRVT